MQITINRPEEDNFNILGGIGGNESERFKTTAMRQGNFEGLSYEQLTIEKVAAHHPRTHNLSLRSQFPLYND